MSTGEERAWGWVRHLRDGGTTPWLGWTTTAPPQARALPGAQQLELVRRLNLAGHPSPELVERVLAASAPGRGQPDLELVGAVPELRFGPRPADPATLPAGELLRVAASLLAEDLAAAGLPERPRPGRVRPWRTRYRLGGDPELALPLRDHLVAAGRPPGGRGRVAVVVATDLGRMLADAWTVRSFGTGAPGWRTWLETLAQRDHVPARVDPLRVARTWATRVGPQRVHVVLDPAALPALLGVRRLPPPPPAPAAEVPDLGRRVAGFVGLHVPDADRRAALLQRSLRPRLDEAPGLPLVVPARHRAWVEGHAHRIADGLLRAGYAVHGDPQSLVPQDSPGVEGPSPAATLALAMRMIMTGAATEEGA